MATSASGAATSTRGGAPIKRISPPALICSANTTQRAVSFGNDRENIFRFARTHRAVTIVKGTSAFHDAAVKRLNSVDFPALV